MLFSSDERHGRSPLSLSGFGAATDPTQIVGLQTSLANLAIATQNSLLDPGPITGTLTDGTMLALALAMTMIAPQLPGLPRAALDLALLAGSTTTLAKNATGQYAPQLTAAINATTSDLIASQVQATTPVDTGFFQPGWYLQPYGIAVLVGAGIIGIACLVSLSR